MILFFLSVSPAISKENDVASAEYPDTIVVKEGQNVRELAKTYLNDPNLWTEILRVNDLSSPAEVRPNMTLKLPDPIINQASDELKKAQQAIDEASKSGARIFAPGIIGASIQLLNIALAKRKAHDWQACFETARAALEKAREAVEKSVVQSDVVSQAILTDRKGTVQSRRPSDQLWKDLSVNSILVEGEKVRTLSESYAEIQFKDDKRVRLNENSQIVISKMEAQVLKSNEETSVSLMKGDAYMLLDGKASNSKKKQRPSVTYGKQLPPPALISPGIGKTVIFGSGENYIDLQWEEVASAIGYWLEIAADRGFKRMLFNQKNLKQRTWKKQLKDGVYYWRVAALDQNGFPGTNSKIRYFKIASDTEPPYLVIHFPRVNAILEKNPAKVRGETEPDAILTFEGRTIEISEDGTYAFDISMTKGGNEILLESTDSTGNKTKLSRSFIFDPKVDVAIHYDPKLLRIAPKHFITSHSAFTLKGRTEPNTTVSVHTTGKPYMNSPRCFTDDKGRFQITLPLKSGAKQETAKAEFTLSVTSLGGHVTQDKFIVEMDKRPPDIRLANEPPAVLADKEIQLSGDTSEKSAIWLNDRQIQQAADQFDVTVALEPGVNSIRLAARDQAGNISFSDRKVILDQHPPKIIKYKISHDMVSGGETVNISILAEDESDLKEVAEFSIQAEEYTHVGFLKLNNATQFYQGTVNLPERAKGKLRLSHVRLSDYNNNEKEYRIDN